MRRLKIRKDLAAQELGIPVAWEKEEEAGEMLHDSKKDMGEES